MYELLDSRTRMSVPTTTTPPTYTHAHFPLIYLIPPKTGADKKLYSNFVYITFRKVW